MGIIWFSKVCFIISVVEADTWDKAQCSVKVLFPDKGVDIPKTYA